MRTTMHVVEFLKKYSLERLSEKYGIVVSDYPDRVVLNYDQINSDSHKFSPIVMECRGLILAKPTFKVLCRPFERFFNLKEDPKNKNFPFLEALCFEKVDGSLINVYHDDKQWCAATRKMAFAEGSTRMGRTFLAVFEQALGKSVNTFFAHPDNKTKYTYSFELVSPETCVVKPYSSIDTYLLNIRDRETGKDLSLDDIQAYSEWLGIKQPKKYWFNSPEHIIEAAKELPAMEEGYVAYCPDKQWRVKIKNPAYLAIAHLRSNGVLSIPRIVPLVMSRDEEEYLCHFPEDRTLFEPFIKAFESLRNYVNFLWIQTKHIKDQKEFAKKILDKPGCCLLFAFRKGERLDQILDNMTPQAKERLLMEFLRLNVIDRLFKVLQTKINKGAVSE